MRCTISYHLYNFKNVENTHREVLLLVKLQAATLLKVTLLHGCFSRFLKCTNDITQCNAPNMIHWCNIQTDNIMHLVNSNNLQYSCMKYSYLHIYILIFLHDTSNNNIFHFLFCSNFSPLTSNVQNENFNYTESNL